VSPAPNDITVDEFVDTIGNLDPERVAQIDEFISGATSTINSGIDFANEALKPLEGVLVPNSSPPQPVGPQPQQPAQPAPQQPAQPSPQQPAPVEPIERVADEQLRTVVTGPPPQDPKTVQPGPAQQPATQPATQPTRTTQPAQPAAPARTTRPATMPVSPGAPTPQPNPMQGMRGGPTNVPGFVPGMAPGLVERARAQGIAPRPGMQIGYNNFSGGFTQVPQGQATPASTGPGIIGFLQRDFGGGFGQGGENSRKGRRGGRGIADRLQGIGIGTTAGGILGGPVGAGLGGIAGGLLGRSGFGSLFGGVRDSFGGKPDGWTGSPVDPSSVSQATRDAIEEAERQGVGGLF